MPQMSVVATAEQSFVENEHRELAPGIDHIHRVGMRVGTLPPAELTYALLEITAWVTNVLEPHAAWEEAFLYNEIDERAGTPWATRLMRFEHEQMRGFTRRLEALREALRHEVTHDELSEVRATLFGLEALIRAHIEREEAYLIPLVER